MIILISIHRTTSKTSLADTHVLVTEVLKASSLITNDILVPWIIFYAISSVVR